MSFSLGQILLFIIVYLTGLFAVAHLADRGIIPERIIKEFFFREMCLVQVPNG